MSSASVNKDYQMGETAGIITAAALTTATVGAATGALGAWVFDYSPTTGALVGAGTTITLVVMMVAVNTFSRQQKKN